MLTSTADRAAASSAGTSRLRAVLTLLAAGAIACASLATVGVATASAATPTVLASAPQSGSPGMESSMAFTPTADPTLLAQLDNQQGSDADSTVYSQAFQPVADGSVNTITWWGTGAAQTGFMVAIHDGVWGSTTTLPNGPVVEGTLASLNVVPMSQIVQTPSINGETQYQLTIPSTPMLASHAYRLSVTAIGGSFEWDTSSALGCCTGSTAVDWVRGRLQSYLAGPNVSFSLANSNTAAVPAITWPAPTSISYGVPLSSVQLNASSSVPGSFSYSPASGSVLSAGTQQLHVTFTPTDAVTYQTVTATVPLTVSPLTPKQSWTKPATISYGTPLGASQLRATSPVAGSFSYSPPSGSVLAAGSHTLIATFSPLDAVDYLTPSPISTTITVAKAPSQLAINAPASSSYGAEGMSPFAAQVSSSSGQAITGKVSFKTLIGTTVTTICTATVAASGAASCAPSAAKLGVGSHAVWATFASSPNYSASTSATVASLVVASATALVATPVVIPATGTHNVTFSASLHSLVTLGAIAGQHVSFTLGAQSCSGTTSTLGTASCTMSVVGPGPASFSAAFPGTTGYLASSSSAAA